MTALRELPEVDLDGLGEMARLVSSAARDTRAAQQAIAPLPATTSWEATQARPAWNEALGARDLDLQVATRALEHAGRILELTARELGTSTSQYVKATWELRMLGDGTPPADDLSDLLDPNRPGPDPQWQAQHDRLVRQANGAVDDAEYLLALCAKELLGVAGLLSPAVLPSQPVEVVHGYGGILLPIAPAWGAPSGALFVGGVPVPFKTGRAFEQQVLRSLGIAGGSKSFYRPDANGNYNLPRTRSGRLYRGTFPDSMRAGLLEIKSGTSEIKLSSPQIRVQLWAARTLQTRMNLVVSEDTPVEGKLLNAISRTGGSVYRAVGGTGLYVDEVTQETVRLTGGHGAGKDQLHRAPLSDEEYRGLSETVREAIDRFKNGGPPAGGASPGGGTAPSPAPAPSRGPATHPYVDQSEYYKAWGDATIVVPHQPGGVPIVPIVPLPGPLPLPGLPPLPVPGLPLLPIPVP